MMPPRGRIAKVRKGAGFMMVAVITGLMVAFTSMGVTKINQASMGGMNNSRIMLQAQQFAEAEAAVVKATAYDDLSARSKVEIQNSNGYFSEVTLSAESDYAENVKRRIASINIYKGNEDLPRYSLQVLKTDVEVQASGGGVPIGTIIVWASNTAPTEGGTWLLCDGRSCSAYPKLVALVGSTVPNLQGRFLEGTTSTNVRSTKSAGLPNITGTFTGGESGYGIASGAFSKTSSTTYSFSGGGGRDHVIDFKASRSSSIYGASSTVQPPSYLVKYYIKAT